MTEDVRQEAEHLSQRLSGAADLVAREVDDLSGERMTFSRDEPVWARWSAEVQLRHMACVPCRWLHGIFREGLENEGYRLPEVDMETIQAGTGRHVPPEICPDRESLIAHMRMMFDFCLEILDRETPESLRALKCVRLVDTGAWREDSPERPIDFWRMLAKPHPYWVHEDPDRPGHFPKELIAVLRQIYWETLAHLRTIQRLKGLMELTIRAELPREGYLTVPKFYD
jgi:hypothetical protein